MKILAVHRTPDAYWTRFYARAADVLEAEITLAVRGMPGDDRYAWQQGEAFPAIQYLGGTTIEGCPGPGETWVQIRKFLVLLRSLRPDVMILGGLTHSGDPFMLFAARMYGVLTVVQTDTNMIDEKKKPFLLRSVKRFYLALIRGCIDRVWTTGKLNEAFWSSYGFPASCMQGGGTYPVDTETIASSVSRLRGEKQHLLESHGIKQGPVLLCVGRLVPEKGTSFLIEAFASLRKRCSCSLVLVGEGAEREHLESYVCELGLSDVCFAGPRTGSELLEFYAMADLYVQPSLCEPWGIVILEAVAAGLPVVATDCCGAAADLLREGENAILVPPGNPEVLEKAISEILGDESYQKNAARSAARIVAKFGFKKRIENFGKLLEVLMSETNTELPMKSRKKEKKSA